MDSLAPVPEESSGERVARNADREAKAQMAARCEALASRAVRAWRQCGRRLVRARRETSSPNARWYCATSPSPGSLRSRKTGSAAQSGWRGVTGVVAYAKVIVEDVPDAGPNEAENCTLWWAAVRHEGAEVRDSRDRSRRSRWALLRVTV